MPPAVAEGSCGYGAASLVPHAEPPVVDECSSGYGATSMLPNTISLVDEVHIQVYFLNAVQSSSFNSLLVYFC